MAVAKYWFEQHGAIPAAMSHDELEFLNSRPLISQEQSYGGGASSTASARRSWIRMQDDPHCGNLGGCAAAVHRLVLLVGLMGDCDHERIPEAIY